MRPVVEAAKAVRELCWKWIARRQRFEGAGEYGIAGQLVLSALDGTVWCETVRCPGHPVGTLGQPCLDVLDALSTKDGA